MSIKLTTEDVRIVGTFERIADVHVKDCIIGEDSIYFLVEPGKLGKAIGKNGANIKRLCRTLGKNIKIFEYAKTCRELVKNLIPKANSVDVGENGTITVSVPRSEKSGIIGKGGRNIKMVKGFLKRHFGIENLRLK